MIHLYTLENIRKPGIFRCFQGVLKQNIGLNWIKQLWNVLIQLQGEHLLRHLQKRTLILKKELDLKLAQDERARPTACTRRKS